MQCNMCTWQHLGHTTQRELRQVMKDLLSDTANPESPLNHFVTENNHSIQNLQVIGVQKYSESDDILTWKKVWEREINTNCVVPLPRYKLDGHAGAGKTTVSDATVINLSGNIPVLRYQASESVDRNEVCKTSATDNTLGIP